MKSIFLDVSCVCLLVWFDLNIFYCSKRKGLGTSSWNLERPLLILLVYYVKLLNLNIKPNCNWYFETTIVLIERHLDCGKCCKQEANEDQTKGMHNSPFSERRNDARWKVFYIYVEILPILRKSPFFIKENHIAYLMRLISWLTIFHRPVGEFLLMYRR